MAKSSSLDVGSFGSRYKGKKSTANGPWQCSECRAVFWYTPHLVKGKPVEVKNTGTRMDGTFHTPERKLCNACIKK